MNCNKKIHGSVPVTSWDLLKSLSRNTTFTHEIEDSVSKILHFIPDIIRYCVRIIRTCLSFAVKFKSMPGHELREAHFQYLQIN
jgi:hypothetical protein